MKLGKFLVSVAAILAIPFSSYAICNGDEICNGGDVIMCPTGPIQTLDIVERGALYGFSPRSDEGFLSFVRSLRQEAHFDSILSPLKKLSREMHKCLNSYVKNDHFWAEMKFVKSSELGDVKDESAFAIPNGCKKEQAIIQFRRTMPISGPRYLINDNIWKQMNDYQRAALILHEVVLRNYILNPQWNGDTKSVRYLVGLLTSADITTLTRSQFESTLKELSFTCTTYR